jgi:hypothetical protein
VRCFLLLSVHYRHPELLTDQIDRLRRCAAPVRSVLGAELLLVPILHRWAAPAIADAVLSAGTRHEWVKPVDLRERTPEEIPEDVCHGHSLAAASRLLAEDSRLDGDDLVASLDHDVHPLHAESLARLGARLLEADGVADVAGVGIPQWHRGHCYLHPSLLLTRADTLKGMGFETAFELRSPAANGRKWSDTGEGFTIWCEGNGRSILPLRVESTAFPWSRWDSNMVPGGGTGLTGWHGEPVRVGSLMRYGLSPGEPLVSHLWAGPLDPYRWMEFTDRTWDEAVAAYLAEPLAGAG